MVFKNTNPPEGYESELWKLIPGAKNGAYKISETGKVWSSTRKVPRFNRWKGWDTFLVHSKILKPSKIGCYLEVAIVGLGRIYLHKLVALAFIPNIQNKPCCNHKDGNKLNNHFSNLEWVTPKENVQHAVATGLMNNKGSRHGLSKLTEEDIPKIRALLKQNIPQAKIAKMFNVGQTTISHINLDRRWKHVLK